METQQRVDSDFPTSMENIVSALTFSAELLGLYAQEMGMRLEYLYFFVSLLTKNIGDMHTWQFLWSV